MSAFSPNTRPACSFGVPGILLFVLMSLLVAGCGSTKVYTANKSLVYRGTLYNVTDVQQIGSKVTGELATGEMISPTEMESKAIKSLLKEHDAFTLTTTFLLDDKEVVYERVNVDSYSDYTKHSKRFSSAQKKLIKFMSEAKATQLELD
ncbi:hypothetical protein E2F43_14665 [Seongchinamella unica]|uniref:Uncharacterized protein n=1 Tax=Seongchinamella unica TaxID=2547392 RepID=A0A4R5LQF8_9GAMM|nr:hypothetical protein [Seongchinamella unica]TDG12802.1 hypothetical protein E2F43_14665 [Seongchinamella unica]